jgi:hypothetical protein
MTRFTSSAAAQALPRITLAMVVALSNLPLAQKYLTPWAASTVCAAIAVFLMLSLDGSARRELKHRDCIGRWSVAYVAAMLVALAIVASGFLPDAQHTVSGRGQ